MAERTPPLVDIGYHNYVAMVTFLEEPHAVRLTGGRSELTIHDQIRRDFTRSCGRYRQEIVARAHDYWRVNVEAAVSAAATAAAAARNLAANASGSNAAEAARAAEAAEVQAAEAAEAADAAKKAPRGIDPYLFNPAHWMAFGRSDALSVVLFDDFDPMISVMAEIKSPIDQATLAFCPRAATICPGLGGAAAFPFVEPHELFTAPPPRPDRDFAPSVHPFQVETPLMVVTRFKIGGMAVLGGGMVMQQAVLRTMARLIRETLARLANEDGPTRELGIRAADVRRVRCAILDGQGSEDIILLVACNNYSIGISLVTRLRCLTFGDVFRTDPQLPTRLDERPGPLHAALRVYERPEDIRRGWGANHIFCTTYSTLAATASAVRAPETANVRGRVRVVAQLDANPGHMADVERVLDAAHGEMLIRATGPVTAPVRPSADFHRFLTGRHDYLGVVGEARADGLQVIPIRLFFHYLKEVQQRVGATRTGAVGSETGLMDFSSSIVVPFPNLGQIPPVDADAHYPVMQLLLDVRDRLFSRAPGAFDPDRLRDATQRARMPWSLRLAVDRLYQTFADCLADPHRFDGVLDLYDTFATLYTYLTEYLPAYQERQGARDGRPATPFGQWLTTHLNSLLDAIQNASDHRVRMMLPDTDMRDRGPDIRGGLSKLVAAADIPLKCGLYVVNRALQDGATGDLPLNRVGGVTRLTTNPQAIFHVLFTPRPDPRYLFHVRSDVAHIYRPARFVAYFHEAAHLLYAVDPTPPGEAPPEEIAEEVFAELLTLLIVFGTDTELYLRRYVADYGTQPLGHGSGEHYGDTDARAEQRFFQVLFRGFVVTRPVAMYWAARRLDPRKWPSGYPEEALGADAENEFILMVRQVGPFYESYHQWWSGPDAAATEAVWRELFRDNRTRWHDVVTEAWERALWNYQEWVRSTAPQPRLARAVVQAVEEGRPTARMLAALDTEPEFWNLHLVCGFLRGHVRHCFGDLDRNRGLHLRRDDENGEVTFDDGPRHGAGWNRFLIDGTYGGLLCVEPTARRERLRREVVILKSFWDLSTHLRSDRLDRILRLLEPD